MTIRVTTSGDTTGVTHRWYPASEAHGAFGILAFGYNAGDAGADIHLHQPAEIDEVIAALTALRAEMTGDAAVEFTSDSRLAPARCQQPGEHGPALAGAVVDCDRPEHHEPVSAEALAAAWPPVPAITVTDDEPEDHPDTAGPTHGEAELRRADAYRDHPDEADGLAARAALAASVAAGVPLTVYDDEPRCECGHQQTLHDEDWIPSPCRAVACGCTRFSDAASVTE